MTTDQLVGSVFVLCLSLAILGAVIRSAVRSGVTAAIDDREAKKRKEKA